MDPHTDCLCTSSEGSQCVQKGIVGSGKGLLQKMQATCIPAKFPGVRDPASPPEDSAIADSGKRNHINTSTSTGMEVTAKLQNEHHPFTCTNRTEHTF